MKRLSGLHLVVSPVLPTKDLLVATEKALDGGVDLLQFSGGEKPVDLGLAGAFADLAEKHVVPFLLNNDLGVAKAVGADGVHFDRFGVLPSEARAVLGGDAIVGYTVNVNLEKLRWAKQAGADYVSFCSVFRTCQTSRCPIVTLETIKTACSVTSLPVFAAGGINLKNVHLVLKAGVDGVVVTSAILNSKDPQFAATAFKEIINKYGKDSP